MSLDLSERRRIFAERAAAEEVRGRSIHWDTATLFGVSNSARIIEGGLYLGYANLEHKARSKVEGQCLLCMLRFPPEDEVYFAVYVSSEIGRLFDRLERMKSEGSAGNKAYSERNNNVAFYLARDGHIYLQNRPRDWDLNQDLLPHGPPTRVDRILFAVYPPLPSPRRSLLAREFVGYLGSLVGPERLHEVRVWPEEFPVSAEMKRMPAVLPLADLGAGVSGLGGYYLPELLEQYHVAMGYLRRKHFVILSGISGSGKTQLAVLYAKAVHGLTAPGAEDPFFVMCPVRPDWTDPSGLLGYHDPISRKYVVPAFLQAVLLAMTHRETPVFVCIDEMNLARVEYYFSDLLSAMESGEPLQLHGHSVPVEGTVGEAIPGRLPMPENLFITGTVNVDETTHGFSDKVLDRATVIDMSAVDIDGFLSFLRNEEPALEPAVEASRALLTGLERILAPHGVGFGYRVSEEFVRYHAHATTIAGTDPTRLLDDLVRQKILPKLRGGERQRRMLEELGRLLQPFPGSRQAVERVGEELNDLGAFQYWR